jgi:hypothetical protein
MKDIFITTLVLIPFMAGCRMNQQVTQGIQGQVLWYEGNRMPGIQMKADEGKPVQRDIFIYELTNQSDVSVSSGSFYKEIRTHLAAKVKSDTDGFFSVKLSKGIYSVFVKEGETCFTNILDGQGNLNPVEVKKSSVTQIILRIDYKAVY